MSENPEKNSSPSDPSADPQKSAPGASSPGPVRPPALTLIFWVMVLIAIPMSLVFFFNKDRDQVQKLKQSEFERLLINKQIQTIKVIEEPQTGRNEVRGTYIEKTGSGENLDDRVVLKYRAQVKYSEEFDKLLRDSGLERETDTKVSWMGSILIQLLPILILVGVIYFLFSRQIKSAGKGALQFGKSRARLMSTEHVSITFADVAGCDEAKEEMCEIVDFLKDPKKFQRIGGRIPKGVMMVGPPGTGKTLLARAVAGEAGVPFFSISGSDFVEMFVGVGASRVRDMFEEGKRHAPCLIFIDEIDAVGRSRFSGIGGGHDEREQTLNAMLAEMDGFEPSAGIIVLAATNRPDVLDPALMRPGRFDRRIAVDLPDMNGRLGILKIHSAKMKMDPEADLMSIARGTPGFSGADLANLINEAALAAARDGKPMIIQEDLEEARDKVRWGKERRSRKVDEKDRKITAYHEAGHAIVSMFCEEVSPLHKVTIIPRGTAYLGATMNLPSEERYTQTRTEMEDQIAVLMGGRLAEKIIFGDVTSGASMDLRQATELARRMVCEWGMSKHLGPLTYGHREEHIYLGRDITKSQDYSEQTAQDIDTEVRDLVIAQETRAEKLLRDNVDKLSKLGEALLDKETMDAAEIYALLGMEKPALAITEEPLTDGETVAGNKGETGADEGDNSERPEVESAG
ncbi:MAG: ATP-dependent zinc metalloprotease FtsH [Lentisphaeria bacterium]|nr:ATP-dependent zinc metalloprotease FtsH [Lentisphaeria bacterium]